MRRDELFKCDLHEKGSKIRVKTGEFQNLNMRKKFLVKFLSKILNKSAPKSLKESNCAKCPHFRTAPNCINTCNIRVYQFIIKNQQNHRTQKCVQLRFVIKKRSDCGFHFFAICLFYCALSLCFFHNAKTINFKLDAAKFLREKTKANCHSLSGFQVRFLTYKANDNPQRRRIL